MSIKALIAASGMSQKSFAAFFGIPLRTVENWVRDVNKCPAYLVSLIAYRLRAEGMIPTQDD